jgi:hypothetical protein
VSAIALLCLVLLCTPVNDQLQSCGSPGRLAIHSCERMFCALLIVVKTSSRPWGVKRLISSCGSPSGRLRGSILGASNNSYLIALEDWTNMAGIGGTCKVLYLFYKLGLEWIPEMIRRTLWVSRCDMRSVVIPWNEHWSYWWIEGESECFSLSPKSQSNAIRAHMVSHCSPRSSMIKTAMFVRHYLEKVASKEQMHKWEDGTSAAMNDYDVVRQQWSRKRPRAQMMPITPRCRVWCVSANDSQAPDIVNEWQ